MHAATAKSHGFLVTQFWVIDKKVDKIDPFQWKNYPVSQVATSPELLSKTSDIVPKQ